MESGLSPLPQGAGADPRAGPLLIGWREYLGFPDWGIRRVKVKIDTGARTSALDVAGYELIEVDGQAVVAELRLALHRKDPGRLTVVRAPVLGTAVVRNTSGVCEHRPLIETTIRLGPVVKRVRLTVANRSRMRFRMILGRTALGGDFLVDVSKQYLLRS
jgi:hypothetical protein